MGSFDPDPKNSPAAPEAEGKKPPSDDPFERLFEPRDPAATQTLGEFTKLFGAAPESERVTEVGDAGSAEPLPPQTIKVAADTSAGEPGAFTKLFTNPAKASADSRHVGIAGPRISEPEPGATVAPPSADDEETCLLNEQLNLGPKRPPAICEALPHTVAEPANPVPVAETSAPGAFTKLFQSPAVPSPEKPESPRITLPLQPSPTAAAPGGFTQLFSGPAIEQRDQDAITPTVSTPFAARAEPVAPAVPARSPSGPAPAPAASPGSFTQLFGGPVMPSANDDAFAPTVTVPAIAPSEAKVRPPAPPAASASVPPESKLGSGEFTSRFGAPSPRPASEKLKEVVPATPNPPIRPATSPAGSSDQEFARAFNFPLRDSSPAASEPPTATKPPGEFTNLFGRATFAPRPAVSPKPADTDTFSKFFNAPGAPAPGEASAKEPGAFTKLFGRGGVPLESVTRSPEPQPSAGAFTKLFGTTPAESPQGLSTVKDADAFRKLFAADAPAPQPRPEPPLLAPKKAPGAFTEIFGKASPSRPATESAVSSPPVAGPPPSPQEKQQMPSFFAPATGAAAISTKPEGATQIFSRPQSSAPAAPEPAGPSAFTQIISGGMVRQAQQQAAQPTPQPPQAPPAAPVLPFFQPQPMGFPMPTATPPAITPPTMTPGSIGVGGVTPPAVSMPGMTPPAMQMPYMAPPQVQMPAAQFPPMQVPYPQPAAPPQPASSAKMNWLPLIIGANVLFVLIVILILIFALKK